MRKNLTYKKQIQLCVFIPAQGLAEIEPPTYTHCRTSCVMTVQDETSSKGQRSKDFALVYTEHAPPRLLPDLVHSRPHRVLKHLLHASVAQGGALQVAFSVDLLSHAPPLRC